MTSQLSAPAREGMRLPSAAQMGKKTCIIESTYLGGTCLNVGCIPTKTLIKTANVLDTVKHAADFAVEGVDLSALKVDMAKLQKRRQKVVSTWWAASEACSAETRWTFWRERPALRTRIL